jgi:serine/threonine kinase 32
LEELLLEDNPLKAKQRKANQDNLSAEMRQMEEQCVSNFIWFELLEHRRLFIGSHHMISRRCRDGRITHTTSS